MTYRSALEEGKKYLENSGVPEPETDAWYLLEHVCGFNRTGLSAAHEPGDGRDRIRPVPVCADGAGKADSPAAHYRRARNLWA